MNDANDASEIRQPEAPELASRVDQFLDRLALRDVRVVKLHGELFFDPPPRIAEVDIRWETPAYAMMEGQFANRFTCFVSCRDDDEDEIAQIQVAVVTDFLLKGDDPVDEDTISCFSDRNSFFMAFPYLRESVQAVSARMGLDPVVLGILRRDQERAATVSVGTRMMRQSSSDLLETTAADRPSSSSASGGASVRVSPE